ncbi:heme-binding protein 1-like isoform X1 [Passer montanus]|uniref:heme-binding protein 1-like isoform X1 n=2 Tax=Passer montanus TaxID=9160 RepID=UPI001962014A|nr:heme-binding protein 1-like isoform X1 [Passer montanus]XP_039573049.1 heme-binding protein 1-like isoform X1 [Passer montanus]
MKNKLKVGREVLATTSQHLFRLPVVTGMPGTAYEHTQMQFPHSPCLPSVSVWEKDLRSFIPVFAALLGARALLPDFPFCWVGMFLLPSVHAVFQGKGTAPENNISLTGGPWVPGIRNILCEEAAYEERQYPAGKWACVTMGEPMYEQSISMSFMKLMRYICKENSVGCYLGMTVPVLNEIHLTKEGTELEREVLTAYYLPGQFQQNPPVPMDPEIHITERAPLRVITRVFYGMTTEETILREISLFWELLGSTDMVLQGTYIVASYENPSIPQRRNEIWFICRAE